MNVRWCLLVTLLFLLAGDGSNAVHVGRVSCGATIPIDSNFLIDPSWSLSPHRNAIQSKSGSGIQFTAHGMSNSVESVIRSEAGADPAFVIVFQVANDNTTAECSIQVDPLLAGLAGRVASSMRLVALNTVAVESASCPTTSTVTISNSDVVFGNLPLTNVNTTSFFAQSASFPIAGNGLPLSLTIPSGCQIQLLVLVDRAGSIKPWYVWIPTTAYSGLVTLIILPHLFFGHSTPAVAGALVLFLVFLGYLGSMIGLIVEVICWQSSLGRLFPFPSSVTLYCCLAVLYGLYMLILLIRHQHRRLMLIAMTRLLVYGANVALCVGYWIAGYVVLGSLGIFQYLVTNCFLTAYYAYASVRLKQSAKRELSVDFSRAMAYMWLAPVTPFAVCALFYVDLHVVSAGRKNKSTGLQARVADAVYLYNVQVSIPLLFIQNIYGIALLAAATAFHMPFLIVLFPLLLLFIVQMVCTIEQYISEYQRWMRRKPFRQYCEKHNKSPGGCGCLFLSSAFHFIFEENLYRDCLEKELQANGLVYYADPAARQLSPSARRSSGGWGLDMGPGLGINPVSTYERDMAMLREQHSASASPTQSVAIHRPGADDGETVYFPPLPSRSPSHHRRPLASAEQTPATTNRNRRRDLTSRQTSPTEDGAADYSTPSRRVEEYWPDSIER